MQIKNYIDVCLECCKPLPEELTKNPKNGKKIVCPFCGAEHIIEVSYSIAVTGKFDRQIATGW